MSNFLSLSQGHHLRWNSARRDHSQCSHKDSWYKLEKVIYKKIFENTTFVRLEFYNLLSHRVAIQYGNILWIVLWPLSQNFSERKTLSRNSTRRKSGGSNGLKQGNQVFRGKSFQSLQPWIFFFQELLVKSNGIFVKDMKLERFAMTCCTEEQSNQEGVDGENLVSETRQKRNPFFWSI